MKFFFFLSFFLSFFLFGCGEKGNEARFEKLQTSAKGKNPIIDLKTDTLKVHAGNAHNYSIIMLVTTQDKDIPCPACSNAYSEFQRLVETYQKSLGPQGVYSKRFLDNPIFFARCDVRACYDLLMEANWREIPLLVHIPPRSEKGKVQPGSFPVYSRFSEDDSAVAQADFLKSTTGYQLNISASDQVNPYLLYGGTLLFGLFLIRSFFPRLWKRRSSPLLWFIICMGVYAFSMSGFVFNAINKPPFNYRNPYNGQTHFIYPNSRQQFVVEGLMMAALLTTMALVTAGIGVWVPSIKDPWKQKVAFLLLILLFYGGYTLLFKIFKVKHPYYPLA